MQLLLIAILAGSAQGTAAPPPAVAEVIRCAEIAAPQERLACYDAQVKALGTAVSSGAVVAMDAESVKKTRRGLFGLDLPNLPFFSGDGSGGEDAPRELVAKVRSARPYGHQLWLIALDEGGTWQTTEATPNLSPPKVGQEVKIKKSGGGGYMLHLGSRLIRIKRTA